MPRKLGIVAGRYVKAAANSAVAVLADGMNLSPPGPLAELQSRVHQAGVRAVACLSRLFAVPIFAR